MATAKDEKKINPNVDFDWELHPDLDNFINDKVKEFLSHNKFANSLATKMLDKTSTRFVDWIDHMAIPENDIDYAKLADLGLEEVEIDNKIPNSKVFRHLRSYLFPIVVWKSKNMEIAIKPESIDDFMQVLANGIEIEGKPFAHFRKATLSSEGNYVLSAVERRGYDGFTVKESDDIDKYMSILSAFYSRQRYFDDDDKGMEYTEKLIVDSVRQLDSARVSDAFFRAERAYWQKRNRAGQVQKARQDVLGLGWGNHDHHTYRSSRENFTRMIRIFEKMGYSCREKYYAGEKAGWGAQIMEHKACNIVVFTDVDLNPDETTLDFAHSGFVEREDKLRTIGMWIALHGESMLQAGMHHLEARFSFEKLTNDLYANGVELMNPFSNFDFLKQAFTKGEVWQVDKKRLDKLLSSNLISKEQYDAFTKEGAIGSHMENLERDQGFKGFNKASVTKIILETDPTKQHAGGA